MGVSKLPPSRQRERTRSQWSAHPHTPLNRYRRLQGLTLAELAAKSGVSIATINNLERGVTGRPHLTTVIGLCAALDAEPRDLFPELYR